MAQNKARLRHGAFHGINQQQHAIDHVHDALDLAAKVGVAGRIHNVDGYIVVDNARILGQNRNPALTLQIIRVEHTLLHLLVGAKDLGQAQHAVHQSRLAMIDMGDNGNVANVWTHKRPCCRHSRLNHWFF